MGRSRVIKGRNMEAIRGLIVGALVEADFWGRVMRTENRGNEVVLSVVNRGILEKTVQIWTESSDRISLLIIKPKPRA